MKLKSIKLALLILTLVGLSTGKASPAVETRFAEIFKMVESATINNTSDEYREGILQNVKFTLSILSPAEKLELISVLKAQLPKYQDKIDGRTRDIYSKGSSGAAVFIISALVLMSATDADVKSIFGGALVGSGIFSGIIFFVGKANAKHYAEAIEKMRLRLSDLESEIQFQLRSENLN